MNPTRMIRFATAALVGAMFLPAQSPAEGRRPAAKATASAAERAQVRLAEVMAMLQDDGLSPAQRAEATRKLEEVMAALAAAKAAPVAGQPAPSADSAKASDEVVVVRSSRDSSSAQDSQSSSSSSSSGSGSSRSDTAKATDESNGRAKGKGRARTVLVVPGAAAESSPPPAQQPEPPAPDLHIPTPPKPAKAPKAPKPPKAPRATGALPDAEPPPPPAEGSAFEVSSLEPGTFLLSTEPPEGMTQGVSVEIAEPMVVSEGEFPLVISEEHLESSQPGEVSVRVRAQGLPPLVLESLDADGNRARLLARVLEMRRAQVDQARGLVDVELHGTMQKVKADLDLARRKLEVAQRDMVEAQERMRLDVAAATEAELQALDANRVAIQRAVERQRAADERAAAERDVPPRHVERHTFEVQKKHAHKRAQDAEIRALVEEMRAEMREIRALMRELRAQAGAAPAAGDRLLYVDERRVETKDEAIDAAKDAYRAGRPMRLRWAGDRVDSTAPEAAEPPRVRWLWAEPAPKPECEEGTAPKPDCEKADAKVSTSVGVATFPARGGR